MFLCGACQSLRRTRYRITAMQPPLIAKSAVHLVEFQTYNNVTEKNVLNQNKIIQNKKFILKNWGTGYWDSTWSSLMFKSSKTSIFLFMSRNGILLLKIVLIYCEKKMFLVIEKNFWNSSLKVENLQKFWDGNRMLF